jgi:hypothetical protein
MPGIKLLMRTGFTCALTVLVAACASDSNYSRYSDLIPVFPTSIVHINQLMEIPNSKARVYIQNGKAIPKRELDRFAVYCSVLMNILHEPGEPALQVNPGQFDVTEVRQFNDRFNDSRILVASTMWDMRSMPSNTFFTFEMRLKSTQQGEVRSLICVKESSLRGRHYPSLEEIRLALGDAVTIDLYQPE